MRPFHDERWPLVQNTVHARHGPVAIEGGPATIFATIVTGLRNMLSVNNHYLVFLPSMRYSDAMAHD